MKSTDDCLDPGFGHENKDGYVRIWDKHKPKGGKLVMRHRWFWELLVGKIPPGYEINHLCGNRRCCNPDHLECIDGYHHVIITNKDRYLRKIELAHELHLQGYGSTALAKHFACGLTTVKRWKSKHPDKFRRF